MIFLRINFYREWGRLKKDRNGVPVVQKGPERVPVRSGPI